MTEREREGERESDKGRVCKLEMEDIVREWERIHREREVKEWIIISVWKRDREIEIKK